MMALTSSDNALICTMEEMNERMKFKLNFISVLAMRCES